MILRDTESAPVVLGLRISLGRGKTDIFKGAIRLASLAGDALYTAHTALRNLVPKGRTWAGLHDHVVELVGARDVPFDGVNGDDLALPCALALASLWLEQPIRPWVVGTGRLFASGRVKASKAADIAERLTALRETYPAVRGWSAIVPKSRARLRAPQGIRLAPPAGVRCLSDALEVAGLKDILNPSQAPTRRVRFDAKAERSSDSRFEPEASVANMNDDTMTPSEQLAVHQPRVDDTIPRTRLQAARYLLQRGFPGPGVTEASLEQTDLPWAAELRMADLRQFVADDQQQSAAAMQTAATQVKALGHNDRFLEQTNLVLKGRIHRNLSFFFLHRRDAALALTHAQHAVDAHYRSITARFQVAQSLLACARAHRAIGLRTDDADGARMALREALSLLQETCEWEMNNHLSFFSQPLFISTRMLRDYELGRTHLDLGKPGLAITALLRAKQQAEYDGTWPMVGVLRALVWSYRAIGDSDSANAELGRLNSLSTSGAVAYSRVREEAQKSYQRNGEVF